MLPCIMNRQAVGLHEDWILCVAQAIRRHQPTVVIVGSRNEEILLRQRYGDLLPYDRTIWVLTQLCAQDVFAVVGGFEERLSLLTHESVGRCALLTWTQAYIYAQTGVEWSAEKALKVVDCFLDLYKNAPSLESIYSLSPGSSACHDLLKGVFLHLMQKVEKETGNFRIEEKYLYGLVENYCLDHKVLVAISGWISDVQADFIDRIVQNNSAYLMVADGCNIQDVREPFYFARKLLGDSVREEVKLVSSVEVLSANAQYEEEQELIARFQKALQQNKRVLVASNNLLALRSLMQSLAVQGVEFWNGVGDFVWDTEDGQWILVCARILEEGVTPVLLYEFLTFCVQEDVLAAVTNAHLRQGFVRLEEVACFDSSEVREIIERVIDFRKRIAQARYRAEILRDFVNSRTFGSMEVQDLWGAWVDSWRLARGRLTPLLKSTIVATIVPPKKQEKIWFVHMSDVRILPADMVFLVGFTDYSGNKILEADMIAESPSLLKNKYQGSMEVMNILGVLTCPSVVISYYKFSGGRAVAPHKLMHLVMNNVEVRFQHVRSPLPCILPLPKSREEFSSHSDQMPVQIGATGIVELLDNPRDFYIKYVLGLRSQSALGERVDQRDFGILIHEVMAEVNLSLKGKLRLAQRKYSAQWGANRWLWPRLAKAVFDLDHAIGYRENACTEQSHKWCVMVQGQQVDINMRVDYESGSHDSRSWFVGDIKTGSRDKIRRLCQDVRCGWQLALAGCEALTRVSAETIEMHLWLVNTGRCETFKTSFTQNELKEVALQLQERLGEYYGGREIVFKSLDQKTCHSQWVVMEDYG